MEAGEYFQSQSKKRQRAEQDRAEQQVHKAAKRQAQRQAAFQPPEVRVPPACPSHHLHEGTVVCRGLNAATNRQASLRRSCCAPLQHAHVGSTCS